MFVQGDESFGFHVKGGEKRKKATEQWLVFHYTTPIFISHIVPGGVADRWVQLTVTLFPVTWPMKWKQGWR